MTVLEYLRKNNIPITSTCGGNGTCKKCLVIIDKQPPVLACRTEYKSGCSIEVVDPEGEMEILNHEIDTSKISDDTAGIKNGHFGIAIDVGTTTIAGVIAEITQCRIIGTKSLENSNRKYGADVISRINSGMEREMQEGLQSDIKRIIFALLSDFGVKKPEVIILNGNTTMIHTLEGYPLSPLGRYPYEPAMTKTIDSNAEKALGISEGFLKNTRTVIFPGVSAYVGGDIVSGIYYLKKIRRDIKSDDIKTRDEKTNIISDDIQKRENNSNIISDDIEKNLNTISDDMKTEDKISKDIKNVRKVMTGDSETSKKCRATDMDALSRKQNVSEGIISNDIGEDKKETHGFIAMMDLGTNGEMALFNDNTLLACSTSAGPVFEGGNITCGMPSVKGAIDHIHINIDKKNDYTTIGNNPFPLGLCGSGVIDCAAGIIERGMCDVHGTFTGSDRYKIAKKPDRSDIYFTQEDMRQLQLAKSAIISGLSVLCKRAGITFEDIDALYLAGGLGYSLDLDSAVKTGLIPESLRNVSVSAGNAALKGALRMLSGDIDENIKEAEMIAGNCKIVDLAMDPDFEDTFLENIDF